MVLAAFVDVVAGVNSFRILAQGQDWQEVLASLSPADLVSHPHWYVRLGDTYTTLVMMSEPRQPHATT